MAPAKKESGKGEKEARLTPEQSAALILDFLRKQNRPYSATDISANLKNRVTKTAAAKLLKDMHERAEIEGRAAGKQLVYHALQDEADETTVENLQQMDTRTATLKESITALKVEEKDLRTTLRQHSSQVSIAELRAAKAALEGQVSGMAERLSKLQSGSMKPVSLEERERTRADHRKWERHANVRRKIRAEMWAEIRGVVEKEKVEATKEELGLEF